MKVTRRYWQVFIIFLRLGLTSFGGPVAHLGYFREEFVNRRRWLSDHDYADLVALCQFLPGPASSQVGMALGLSRAGYGGALAAWLGFTLPSALAMILFALGVVHYGHGLESGALAGLKLVAVAVVAQALWGMARNLCPDATRASLMLLAAAIMLLAPWSWMQLLVILGTGLVGWGLFKPEDLSQTEVLPGQYSRRAGGVCLSLFALLLLGLPVLVLLEPGALLALMDAFYRAGSLVFGGGHVVLPLLQAEVVHPGWVSADHFLAGYGAVQAMPGPLFTFAAFLGAAMPNMISPWLGGLLCLLAIFLPSFLLVAGVLPFWQTLHHYRTLRAALMGVNAGVVGLLLAALYDPVWTSAVHRPLHFVLVLLALGALMLWRLPPWLVVIAGGLVGAVVL